MPYANQALETLLWSSIVGDDEHADQFEHSTGLADHLDALFQAFEEIVAQEMPDFDPELDFTGRGCGFEQMEHDFVLTVNGHGAGFWDGGWISGDKLTELCKRFAGIEVYKGDDGIIYAC